MPYDAQAAGTVDKDVIGSAKSSSWPDNESESAQPLKLDFDAVVSAHKVVSQVPNVASNVELRQSAGRFSTWNEPLLVKKMVKTYLCFGGAVTQRKGNLLSALVMFESDMNDSNQSGAVMTRMHVNLQKRQKQ